MINLNNFDWGWMEDTNVTNLKPLLTQELFVNRIYEKFFEVEEGDIVLDSVDNVDIKWDLWNDHFIEYYKQIIIHIDNR